MSTTSPTGFDFWGAVEGLRDALAPRVAGRMGRGDIRTAILVALLAEPMHGYQVIQSIEARTRGTWKPSPGSIYPTLQLLADEGLVTAEQVGERKVYSLTEAGREAAAEFSDGAAPWEPRRSWGGDRNMALPKSGAQLAQAITQVAHSGTPEQSQRAVEILDEARRKLYAILAES